MLSFLKVPSMCHRCLRPVPRWARSCPECQVPLGRMSMRRTALLLAGAALLFAAIAGLGYLVYYIISQATD